MPTRRRTHGAAPGARYALIAAGWLIIALAGCVPCAYSEESHATRAEPGAWLVADVSAPPPPHLSLGEGQGGGYVYFDPLYPDPAYDRYEWTLTVQKLPLPSSYYFWALQNGFVGGGAFYVGLQPYGSCPGGGNCRMALFSYFGDGAVSSFPGCSPGADYGPGMSCHIRYEWAVGRAYRFAVVLTGSDNATETWEGRVTDALTTVATTIGRWSVPATNGLIGTQGLSFVEYYVPVVGGCAQEPYAQVDMSVPTGYNAGGRFVGKVRATSPTSECAQYTRFSIRSTDVIVQTGNRKR